MNELLHTGQSIQKHTNDFHFLNAKWTKDKEPNVRLDVTEIPRADYQSGYQ